MGDSNIVQPLLPQCLNGDLTQANFDSTRAFDYQPNQWSYYQSVLPTTIPGIVLGALSALGFILLIVWIIVQYCVCCCGCCHTANQDPELDAQFIKQQQEGSYGDKAVGLSSPSERKRTTTTGCTKFLQISIIILTLGTIGVSGWGIYVSLQNTSYQITNFWGLVDSVDGKITNTTTLLNDLSTELSTLQPSLDTIAKNSNRLQGPALQLAASMGLPGDQIQSAFNSLGSTSNTIKDVQQKIDEAVTVIQQNIGTTVTDMQNRFKDPSLTFENKGRLIAIACMFGLTIISALFVCLFSIKVNHPIWASVFAALFWLCVALLMLLGVGLLKGMKYVSKDSCLYAETFAMQLADQKVADPTQNAWIKNALRYYFTQNFPPNEPQGSAISAVTGINIQPIYDVLTGPQIGNLTALISSPQATAAFSQGVVDPTTVQAVQNISTVLQPTITTLQGLDYEASRASVFPIYEQLKSYICCDFSSASDNLFIAWTVVGCIGFVLAILCTWRIIACTFQTKKKRY